MKSKKYLGLLLLCFSPLSFAGPPPTDEGPDLQTCLQLAEEYNQAGWACVNELNTCLEGKPLYCGDNYTTYVNLCLYEFNACSYEAISIRDTYIEMGCLDILPPGQIDTTIPLAGSGTGDDTSTIFDDCIPQESGSIGEKGYPW